MDWFVTALGGLVVAVALQDIFRTLFSPSDRGGLSRAVSRSVWRASRGLRRRGYVADGVGAFAMLAVVGTWTALIVLGWAMVYGPHLPEQFVLQSGVDPLRRGGPLDAVYLSMVTLTTLGFGDLVPDAGWLRLAVPLQALLGFGLLSAATSWVLQVFPALHRRRALAVRLALLDRSGARAALPAASGATAADLLRGLAADVTHVRVDLATQDATYYFADGEGTTSLPTALPTALDLADDGCASGHPDVRAAGALLHHALDDLAALLDAQFLRRGGTTREVVAAYAADQAPGRGGGRAVR